MSQHTPPERKLQPLPAWMLKEEEKTGGNTGAGGEEAPSPPQTQEPEQIPRALPERNAVVPFPKPPVFSREEVQPSALRKDDLWEAIWGACLGAIPGAVVGHAIGGGVVATVVGGCISAVGFGVLGYFLPEDVRESFLKGLGWLDCCLSSVVLVVASVVTIAGFLLWQNVLLAALAGGSVLVMMLLVVSVVAASYKAGNQSS